MPPNAPSTGGALKSKFIEIRQVWCLSLRIDAYCSAETFFWRTDHHGAPKGHPKWGPTRLPPKYTFVWYQAIRLDACSQFTTSFWRTTLIGPGEPPKGAQMTQMGPHTTSTEIHLCMVSIDSSRCLLSIYNILLENRPSWAPGSSKEHPKWCPIAQDL